MPLAQQQLLSHKILCRKSAALKQTNKTSTRQTMLITLQSLLTSDLEIDHHFEAVLYYCFIFLLISSNPANATALPAVPANPGRQHVLFWAKFCTTSLNGSPALFSQLCCSSFRHRDIPSTLLINTATSTRPTGTAATDSRRGFFPQLQLHSSTLEPHTHFSNVANSPEKTQLFEPYALHLSIKRINSPRGTFPRRSQR